MDARLAFAVELEQRDEFVAHRLEALAELADRIAHLRADAEAILTFQRSLPGERRHLAEAGTEVAAALDDARATLARAHAALEHARGDEAREAAQAEEARATAAVQTVEQRRDRLAARAAALERDAETQAAGAVELDRRALELAAELEQSPRTSTTAPPERGLGALVDWAARAQAALFVARGGLESERERIVREANELATAVLGEPLHSTNVALVRRELEAALG